MYHDANVKPKNEEYRSMTKWKGVGVETKNCRRCAAEKTREKRENGARGIERKKYRLDADWPLTDKGVPCKQSN